MWKIIAAAIVFAVTPAYAQSVTIFGGNSDAQECYMQTKLPGGSSGVQYCNRALNSNALSERDKAATLVNRGILYNHLRRYAEAEADFKAALEVDADSGEAYINWGNTKIFLKDFEAAKADYTKAIDMAAQGINVKDLHAAYYNRGLAHEALKDLKAAFEDFVEAERLKPEWSMALERVDKYRANGF